MYKCLIANDRDKKWGLTVSTVGYEEIAPGEDYPTKGNADGYYFKVSEGRVLNEFQLQYVVEGKGTLRTNRTGEMELREGHMFLLFPGEWHTYCPDHEVGWKCYWIGFRGDNIDERMAAGFLNPDKPLYYVGYSSETVWLYDKALHVANEEPPYMQQILAGITNHLMGLMYALERTYELTRIHSHSDMVGKAKKRIREALESNLTIQQIAEEMGTSYSNFRKLFKEYTGCSPAAYLQDLKLQRAKELLSTTNMSIKEIAYRLHFDSPDYFSAKFKIKTGYKPSDMRRKK